MDQQIEATETQRHRGSGAWSQPKSEVWSRCLLIVPVLAACLAVFCSAPDGPPAAEQLLSIGSHRLQFRLQGAGEPTVVLDAGITDGMDRLAQLQQRLAQDSRVFAYNRAGYGSSEAGPLPRDCGREAAELKALLEKAQVPGPYVLVGHSLGALNMQLFAARYPDDVAGMVLLDPPPLSFILGQDYGDLVEMADQMTARWQALADSNADSDDPQQRVQAAFFRMIASEHRELFGESARQVAGISSFGDMPLVIVAASVPNPAFGEIAEEYQSYWIEQSRALAKKSSNGRLILAEGASHYLYEDALALVADSVLSVVQQTGPQTREEKPQSH